MRYSSGWVGWSLVVAVTVLGSPAAAQIDVSGEWASTFHEDLPHRGGMRLADYTGLPLNEAGWRKAQSWDEGARSLPERQCIPHVVTYAMRGPATIRFSKIVDVDSGQQIAYSLVGSYGRPRMIWMDGRGHPSDLAPHTWAGFSTGRWERNTLVVTTTHIKTGWLQRNGAPTSDLATMTEFFTRYDDHLLLVSFVNDPVFLSEPLIRTTNYEFSPTANANAWGNCGPAQIGDELPGRAPGEVPHYLPHDRAHVDEFLAYAGVPAEGARGGASTLYPEYAAVLAARTPDATALIEQRALEPPRGVNPRVSPPAPPTGEIRVGPVQGNVYLLEGGGSNVVAQVGSDGVLLVDSGDGTLSEPLLAAVRTLSDKPIRYILNTSPRADHVGGNELLARAGSRSGGGLVVAGPAGMGAMVIAHESVLFALSAPTGAPSPMPVGAWPTDAFATDHKEVFANGEAIRMFHQGGATSVSDTLIFFRRSDVIVTGDVFDLTRYPRIDGERGSFRKVVAALNRVIDIAVPADWQEGGTMVVPGRGRVADEADVVEYRDVMTIIRDRIQNMVDQGMSLAEVRAARPTFEWDARYGTSTGEWTTDMFIDAAYRDLAGASR
jgi:glyoxylase-like metal-dependent hydrolase (beta-lactamase superfamily II)